MRVTAVNSAGESAASPVVRGTPQSASGSVLISDSNAAYLWPFAGASSGYMALQGGSGGRGSSAFSGAAGGATSVRIGSQTYSVAGGAGGSRNNNGATGGFRLVQLTGMTPQTTLNITIGAGGAGGASLRGQPAGAPGASGYVRLFPTG